MKNFITKGKYYWHLFQYRHNEQLQQDCLCEELKSKLKVKATYHNSKAIELHINVMGANDDKKPWKIS